VSQPLARITTDDGTAAFGWSRITKDQAAGLVGFAFGDAFSVENGVAPRFRALEFAIWDLAGRLSGRPVYAILGGRADADGLFRVPCYDTSLYMDDLHLEDDDAAAELMASEALEGAARGHRAFKIKVGRGAMHMPLEEGTRRDIRVIRAVREAAGPDAKIMLDANNGYNLNLTQRVLGETAEARVYWMEEAFHEDPKLYEKLKGWLRANGLETLIADGEGDASPRLTDWAKQGLIDVIQYDLSGYGFTRWIELGRELGSHGVRLAPHHYGGSFGNYAGRHLAAGLPRFGLVEWDEADTPGVGGSAYAIFKGIVKMPGLPGFGLGLDEAVYARAVEENGFAVGTKD
jgi:L-alanine-DL-glutamate epimerase-like enolase superfamily enzyme